LSGPINNRFEKFRRLTKPAEFQTVYKSRKWGNNRLFSFNILSSFANSEAKSQASGYSQQKPDSPVELNAPKLGVTVSKKVSKKAVVRNRIKRIVREYFRLHQDIFYSDSHNHSEIAKGIQIVITARGAAGKSSSTELQQALQDLWQKIEKVLPKL
jgi:ribonuclease P protein component